MPPGRRSRGGGRTGARTVPARAGRPAPRPTSPSCRVIESADPVPPAGGPVPARPRAPDGRAIRGGAGAHAGDPRSARTQTSCCLRWPARDARRGVRAGRFAARHARHHAASGTASSSPWHARIRGWRRGCVDRLQRRSEAPRRSSGPAGCTTTRSAWRAVDTRGGQRPPARRRRGCRGPPRAASAPVSSSCACASEPRGRSTTSQRPGRLAHRDRPVGRAVSRLKRGADQGCGHTLSPARGDSAAPGVPRGDLRLFLARRSGARYARGTAPRRGAVPPPGGRLAGLALRTEGVAGGGAARSHRRRRARAPGRTACTRTAPIWPCSVARTRRPIERWRIRSRPLPPRRCVARRPARRAPAGQSPVSAAGSSRLRPASRSPGKDAGDRAPAARRGLPR